jgi:hypothetical protein
MEKTKNTYLIGKISDEFKEDIEKVIAERKGKKRKPSKENRVIIKLGVGDKRKHMFLKSFKVLTHSEMIKELVKTKEEWDTEDWP